MLRRPAARPKLIAFYLPQFHPIPENDAWWGEGFTEWDNVRRGRPLFKGHLQPRVPTTLGYYDLRDPSVQRAQINMARDHGLHGFCYHHYWFAGKRLLDAPLRQVLADPTLDFPFCVCWANENWSRRWDGSEDEILLAQEHSPDDDVAFIRELIPTFMDPRYIQVRGRPLLVVYRPQLLPDMARTADRWRETMVGSGLPEPFLVNGHTFPDRVDPTTIGFDAALEFPPHGYPMFDATQDLEGLSPAFNGRIHDYAACVERAAGRLGRPRGSPAYPVFPGVMAAWDNTGRRREAATLYANATPSAYGEWLRISCRRALKHLDRDLRFVFVNAWNEWGEGSYLEPDLHHGNAYLRATAEVMREFGAGPP